jgi:hypothetical protein
MNDENAYVGRRGAFPPQERLLRPLAGTGPQQALPLQNPVDGPLRRHHQIPAGPRPRPAQYLQPDSPRSPPRMLPPHLATAASTASTTWAGDQLGRCDRSTSPASCSLRYRPTHRCIIGRCTPIPAATSVTSAPASTARTASRRCSTTDKTTSANIPDRPRADLARSEVVSTTHK